MSKKYRNPVAKHFVYNEETRKSTCKQCFFDMAGRHSENLMRHLKRKHVDTYEEVFAEKLRIRELLCQEETAEADASSRFFYPNTGGLVVKDPTQLQNRSATAVPTINLIDHQSRDGGDSEDNASGSQYDGIFIGKSEIPDLNPTDDESGSGDKDCEELMTETPNTTIAATPMKPHITCASSSTSVINVAPPAPSTLARRPDTGLPSSDDAFYLQYLGNKLSKYSSHTKNTVQYQINKILYKADMGCFEEADSKKDDSDF